VRCDRRTKIVPDHRCDRRLSGGMNECDDRHEVENARWVIFLRDLILTRVLFLVQPNPRWSGATTADPLAARGPIAFQVGDFENPGRRTSGDLDCSDDGGEIV